MTDQGIPVCCYCDAALSCACCGREQPGDVAQASTIPGFTIDALRKQAFTLPPGDQYRLAYFIAENIGMVVSRACTCGGDPDQPPHHHDISCPKAIAHESPREELAIRAAQIDERWRQALRKMREMAIDEGAKEVEQCCFDLIMHGPADRAG